MKLGIANCRVVNVIVGWLACWLTGLIYGLLVP